MNSNFLNQYDIIIFDCDGVLIDVNFLKCEAFGKAVEGYTSEIVENFINYCRKTFGVSRYVKFKVFISEFAKEPFNQEKYEIFLKKYASICKEIYQVANITPGCEKLLWELSSLNKNLYVASGSDEEELNEVFLDRNLSSYFKNIYGSPKTKSECTEIILNKYPNLKAVFIGDALSDFNTARNHRIDFIYMSKYTVQTEEQDILCKNGAIRVINTLEELINNTNIQ
jgi:phosphoglycolate phosphatase-like HAD superfamily hydrolase